MVEYGHKIEGKSEGYEKWNKGKCTDNQQWQKETVTQINGVDHKGERNIQPEQNEETRIQKNEKRLRNPQDIFKHSNIQIIGVPGEEEEQQIENLFEQIMKETFPSLAKEIRLPGSPGSSESPKEIGPRQEHTKTCLLYTSDAADDSIRV